MLDIAHAAILSVLSLQGGCYCNCYAARLNKNIFAFPKYVRVSARLLCAALRTAGGVPSTALHGGWWCWCWGYRRCRRGQTSGERGRRFPAEVTFSGNLGRLCLCLHFFFFFCLVRFVGFPHGCHDRYVPVRCLSALMDPYYCFLSLGFVGSLNCL